MSAPSIQNTSTRIHPTAVISSGAQIGVDCAIGPYAIIGEDVVLGSRVRIDGHCVIDGRTRIGDESHLFPFVSIGLPPQDLKFAGEQTETEIGRRTRIREFSLFTNCRRVALARSARLFSHGPGAWRILSAWHNVIAAKPPPPATCGRRLRHIGAIPAYISSVVSTARPTSAGASSGRQTFRPLP